MRTGWSETKSGLERLWLALQHKELVQCKKDLSRRRSRGQAGSAPRRPLPFEKEFPMELTQALTAITAIISFGFVAAVVLGMV
jgi:hypothetical protein